MCPYERKYGCLNCPLPDCMANRPERCKGNVAEQNRRYREKHKAEIAAKRKEQQRKMKAALEYCERMGIEV